MFFELDQIHAAVKKAQAENPADFVRPHNFSDFVDAISQFTSLNCDGEAANPEYWRGGFELIMYTSLYGEADDCRHFLESVLKHLGALD